MARRAVTLSAALLAALSLSGCVERMLAIHSDPPGAAAYLDGEKVGTTPCEVTYTWYGTRDLILELRGYTLFHQPVVLNAPWWQWLPFDFITDVVIPVTLHDRKAVSFTLEEAPVSQDAIEPVLQRADELRKKSEAPRPKE